MANTYHTTLSIFRRLNLLKMGVALILLICAFVCVAQVSAAEDKAGGSQKGLTLAPLRSEIEAAPGTSYDGKLTVKNSTDKPMTVALSAEEFKVINPQYDYAFTEESNVTKWVVFADSEIDLQPGQSRRVNYQIAVPLTAEPGGRYISLFASSDTQTPDSNVKSKQRIGSLMYMTVLGEVSRTGHMVSLSSPWLVSGPSEWGITLRNSGTTHFRSGYSVTLKNLMGDEVASVKGSSLILPGTVRAVSNKLPIPEWPGIYKAVYTIGLGDSPSVTETRYSIYSPLWVTVLVVGSLLVMISVLVRNLMARGVSTSSAARRYRRR